MKENIAEQDHEISGYLKPWSQPLFILMSAVQNYYSWPPLVIAFFHA